MTIQDLKPHEVQIVELSRRVEAHQYGEIHIVFTQGKMSDLVDSYHRRAKISGGA